MSDPRRLLEDPAVSTGTKHLLGSLEAPSPLAGPMHREIGTRVAKSILVPAAAAKLVSLKAAGLLAAFVIAGGGAALLTVRGPSEPGPVAQTVRDVERPRAPEARAEPRIEPAAPAPAVREPEPRPKPPASERSVSRRDTLALEESLLEQARRSIASPAQALSLLREHERRFPNGELTAERLFLTAQVHARAGNRAAAQRYADLLAARFPKSTYLPRIRTLLAQPARPE